MIFATVVLVVAVASFGCTVASNECESVCTMSQKINELHDWFLNTAPNQKSEDKTIYATCHLQPNPKLNATEIKVKGLILFKQEYPYGKLEAFFFIEGFPVDANQSRRAIHIHEFGDLNNGCDSAGAHYNPYFVQHPDHPGDFGNFRVRNGTIQKNLLNIDATLFGAHSVLGRSTVVHKMADDLGKGNNKASLENGNAGPRLACCVIGTTNKINWDKAKAEKTKLNNAKQAQRAP